MTSKIKSDLWELSNIFLTNWQSAVMEPWQLLKGGHCSVWFAYRQRRQTEHLLLCFIKLMCFRCDRGIKCCVHSVIPTHYNLEKLLIVVFFKKKKSNTSCLFLFSSHRYFSGFLEETVENCFLVIILTFKSIFHTRPPCFRNEVEC